MSKNTRRRARLNNTSTATKITEMDGSLSPVMPRLNTPDHKEVMPVMDNSKYEFCAPKHLYDLSKDDNGMGDDWFGTSSGIEEKHDIPVYLLWTLSTIASDKRE